MDAGTADNVAQALSAPRAGRREWTGLAVIALPCLLYSMDLTVLNLALPALSADLRPTAAQQLWIIDIYGFVLAGMLITMGSLGDRIGRRRMLLVGAGAFAVASILTAFATTASMLIAMRALLGIAGATLAPATLSLIRSMFHHPHERAVAVGVWGASFSAGGAIGPIVGGLLLERFWWGSVFLVAVPIMVLLLVLGPILLPEHRDRAAGKIDLPSAILSLTTMLATIYGVKHLAEHGAAWPSILSIAVGLTMGWLFLRRQLSQPQPMINPRLFRNSAFTAALVTYGAGCFVVFGVPIFVAQYFQLVLGLGPLEAGLWTVPLAVASVVGCMLTPPLTRKVRPVAVMTAGLTVAVIGLLCLSQISGSTGAMTVAAASAAYMLGLAAVHTLAIHAVMGSASPEQAGTISAVTETSSELGGALGIALLGSIGAAMYRVSMAGTVASAEIAGTSWNTLGAAVDTAHRLGGFLGPMLLEASRDAFVRGFRAAAMVSAIILASMVIVVRLWLSQSKQER